MTMTTQDAANPALRDLAALISGRLSPGAVPAGRWAELVDLALSHGIGPLLCWQCDAAHFSMPDRVADEILHASLQWAAVRVLLFRKAQRQLQVAFAAAAVPAIWLKGIVLASSVYPTPATRPMRDLDVLVPYEQRQQALAAVQRTGYHLDTFTVHGAANELIHHYALRDDGDPPLRVEVHSRLLDIGGKDSLLPVAHLGWFWHPDQLLQTGAGFTTLKPEAHLLYLCAHAMLQHGAADFLLQRILDLHLLVNAGSLNWDIVVERARLLRWSLAVEQALGLAQQFFGTSLPPQVVPELQLAAQRGAANPPAKDTRKVPGDSAAFRLNRSQTTWERFSHDIQALTPRQRLRYIRDLLLPAPDYMRQRYQIARNRAVWPYYPLRWMHQGWAAARSVLHLRA